MNEINPNALLVQMRALASRMESTSIGAGPVAMPGTAQQVTGPSFVDSLQKALNSVNEVQKQSSSLQTAFERGDPSVSLADVMVASQKSTIAFQATTQVRNRLVSAYQEIMNMPI